ncbi:fibronectin type III domain-containing protein [Streptomyces sp. NPDC002888]|uniref:fibronectin type III domain-containing protein n=1 Tax=Streptomyces sp. NPDC002888 TaxID=3364668 RepID=UPI00369F2E6D
MDRTAPAQVTGLTATGTTAGNSLAWKPSSKDVEHYEVWGAPEGQQDQDGPEIVPGTSFTDVRAEAGTAYRYTVVAVDGAGLLSPVSAPVTAGQHVHRALAGQVRIARQGVLLRHRRRQRGRRVGALRRGRRRPACPRHRHGTGPAAPDVDLLGLHALSHRHRRPARGR